MEATEIEEDHDAGAKRVVFQLDTNGVSTAQEQMMQTDSILKSLSPLLNSMRPFGLYFNTRRSRVISCETTVEQSNQHVGKRRDWNFAQIYASVILVVSWLNTFRYAAMYDGNETLGAVLFLKLAMIPAALMILVFQSVQYIISHKGILDRVFYQTDLSTSELLPNYGRRAKVATVVCWVAITWNLFHYIYQLFTNGRLDDFFLIFLSKTLPESGLYVVKAVNIVFQLQTFATWLFPLAINDSTEINILSPILSCYCLFHVPGQLSSSNELHGDGFPDWSVRQTERRLQQMYRRSRRVQWQLRTVSSTSPGHQSLGRGSGSVSHDQQRHLRLLQCSYHHPHHVQRNFLPRRHCLIECIVSCCVHCVVNLQCVRFVVDCWASDNA